LNVDNLLLFLYTLDKTKNLYIGGHGDYRNIGNKSTYFHSGGAGFVITHSLLKNLYKNLDTMHQKWKKICTAEHISACDLAISYFIQEENHEIIKSSDFYSCNYKGYNFCNNCCNEKIIIEKIISCHNMTLKDFDDYYEYLSLNQL
jgi:hypothetical protein